MGQEAAGLFWGGGLDGAQYRDDAAKYFCMVPEDGFEGTIARQEPGVAVAPPEHLHGRLAIKHGRDDVPVFGLALLAHHHKIAVANRGVDHGLTDNLQHEQLTLADKLPGEGHDLLDLLIRGDRDAGRDLANKRHVGRLFRAERGLGVQSLTL